jgi:hypothetical protein
MSFMQNLRNQKTEMDVSFDEKEVVTSKRYLEIKNHLIVQKNMLEREAQALLNIYFRVDDFHIDREEPKKTISLTNFKKKKFLLKRCGFSSDEIIKRTIKKYKVSSKEFKIKY